MWNAATGKALKFSNSASIENLGVSLAQCRNCDIISLADAKQRLHLRVDARRTTPVHLYLMSETLSSEICNGFGFCKDPYINTKYS